MANRYPLVIDGSQIKEIPDGDDLYLRNSSISEVKDINALGVINAAEVRVNGALIQSRSILELNDTPSDYSGSENYILKVNSAGTGVEFVAFDDLGEVRFNTLNASTAYTDLIGSVFAKDSTLLVDAEEGAIPYSVISGAPTNLSQFNNDLFGLTIDGIITGDLKGSVFADDSSVIVDAINNTINVGNLKLEGNVINSVSGETEIRSPSNLVLLPQDNIWISTGTKLIFEGLVPDNFEAKLQAGAITADRDILLPDEDGILATRAWVNAQQFNTDIKGSVFADDSTLLVDGVNGTIPWSVISGAPEFATTTLDEINVPLDSDFFINVEDSSAGASFIRITSLGELELLNAIRAAAPNGDLELLTNGTGSIRVHDGQNGLTIDGASGAVSLGGAGTITINGAASSPIVIGSGTSGSVTIGSGSNVVNFPNGTTLDFTGTNILGNTVSYTETDTLTSVTNRGATTINAITVGGISTPSITFTDPGVADNDILVYNSTSGLLEPTALADSGILDTALDTASAVAGDILSWNGTGYAWVAEGGSSINLNDIIDVDTTGAVNGSILKFNGTNWVVGTDETTANPFDQSLDTTDDVTFNSVSTETLTITGAGTSTIQSGNDIVLQAANRTRVEGTPFRVAQLTTTQRNAIASPQNGDIIYNTSEAKFQVRQNGIWDNLSVQSDVAVSSVTIYDFSGAGTTTVTPGNLLLDASTQTVEPTITVSSFSRTEIIISGMIYYGGAPGIGDRRIDIERSINGGTYSVIATTVGSSTGPSHVTYVDTHGASSGDTVSYRFRNNAGSTTLSVDYTKTNQVIVKEI